ncbi:MAG TPA: hypothetical protein HPP66_09080 [Planctomycetes bacterium]|nr:hypothetical protein [Planctomycetota bacterium]
MNKVIFVFVVLCGLVSVATAGPTNVAIVDVDGAWPNTTQDCMVGALVDLPDVDVYCHTSNFLEARAAEERMVLEGLIDPSTSQPFDPLPAFDYLLDVSGENVNGDVLVTLEILDSTGTKVLMTSDVLILDEYSLEEALDLIDRTVLADVKAFFIPDPASLTLAIIGLGTVAMLRRRKALC